MIGLIGQKIGMTQVFLESGKTVPVSVVKIEKNVVVEKKNSQRDGYNALVLGVGDIAEKKISNIYKNKFKNTTPKKLLKEFRTDKIDDYEIGHEFDVESLNEIQYVDVVGISKGKGTQGVMKRHGFHGGPSGHGSKFHRENGSTGQNTYPSHVFKGVKRAGRMGFEKVTVQSLKVIKIDKENQVVLIQGSVPGRNNCTVYVKKSCKR